MFGVIIFWRFDGFDNSRLSLWCIIVGSTKTGTSKLMGLILLLSLERSMIGDLEMTICTLSTYMYLYLQVMKRVDQ